MIINSRRQIRTELKRMRINRKLSQRALAARLGVASQTVCYRESGRTNLDLDWLIRIAALFGYDVALVPARHAGARHSGTGWPT